MFEIENWEGEHKSYHILFLSLKLDGDIFLNVLNISVPRIWRFPVCTVKYVSFSNRFSKDDVLSLYINLRYLS